MSKKMVILIFIVLAIFQCRKEEEPSLPPNLITIIQEGESTVANNINYNKIRIQIDSQYVSVVPTVTVGSNIGTFQSTTLTFDQGGRAYAYLKSAQSGTVDI